MSGAPQVQKTLKAVPSSDVIKMARLFEKGVLTPNSLKGWEQVVETYEREFSEESEKPTASQYGQWQPIETAPKDETPVLLWADHWRFPCTGLCIGDAWHFLGGAPFWQQPTHWMPLPPEPEEK